MLYWLAVIAVILNGYASAGLGIFYFCLSTKSLVPRLGSADKIPWKLFYMQEAWRISGTETAWIRPS